MALIEFNRNPTDRQLRQFGSICIFALPLLTWLWTRNTSWAGYAGIFGTILCGTGLLLPKLLKPVFLGLTIVTMPIGLVVGELAMLTIYLGLFLPMAIVFRLIGRDSLDRRSDKNPETFWKARQQPGSTRSYFRQS
jgi:hypothetical protein